MADAGRKKGLTVEVITATDAFLDLRADWERLHSAAAADIFLAWDWQLPWWRHLRRGRQLWLMIARDSGGNIRGLLALSLETARVGLLRVRRLRFIADEQVGSDYLDALIEPGFEDAAISAFGRALASRCASWDLLEMRDMDEHSNTAHRLCQVLGEKYELKSIRGLLCPAATLDPQQSPDEFIRQSSRGDNYARRRRWLERQPDFRIELCQDATTLAPALLQFFRLHRLRWEQAGGSSGIEGAVVEDFHREALAGLAGAGHVRLYVLWVQGKAVASVYALTRGNTFYYYQSGMDPAWRSRSVGLVLIGETFTDAIRSGFTRYDFLRGEEAYKSDWVNGGRHLASHRLYPRRGRGARAVRSDGLLRSGKGLIKHCLPGYPR